jgi:hypothetical protein
MIGTIADFLSSILKIMGLSEATTRKEFWIKT